MVNRKATKDKKLLSFADDDEEEKDGDDDGDGGRSDEQKKGGNGRSSGGGAVVVKPRMHSSHDSKYKDKKLSSKVPIMSKTLSSTLLKCLKPSHLC